MKYEEPFSLLKVGEEYFIHHNIPLELFIKRDNISKFGIFGNNGQSASCRFEVYEKNNNEPVISILCQSIYEGTMYQNSFLHTLHENKVNETVWDNIYNKDFEKELKDTEIEKKLEVKREYIIRELRMYYAHNGKIDSEIREIIRMKLNCTLDEVIAEERKLFG